MNESGERLIEIVRRERRNVRKVVKIKELDKGVKIGGVRRR